ncbi:MAG TPA: hypothetical protein GX717_08310, partial [Clostridiaceae bacterium]|nr:hypothetical protein [Clostridiaceae bacterium]
MKQNYYIASCVFTSRYPQLSQKIQTYVAKHYGLTVVRCCVPNYKIKEFEEKMPNGYRECWQALADCGGYEAGDTIYTLCHNCLAIIEETKPAVSRFSLWELILSDSSFPYPDYNGRRMT